WAEGGADWWAEVEVVDWAEMEWCWAEVEVVGWDEVDSCWAEVEWCGAALV
ncbi:hypothetical protein Tco_0557454, partial [Tanacetum coccineum]